MPRSPVVFLTATSFTGAAFGLFARDGAVPDPLLLFIDVGRALVAEAALGFAGGVAPTANERTISGKANAHFMR